MRLTIAAALALVAASSLHAQAGPDLTTATPVSGSVWTLDTSGMKPCGYVLQVGVGSRAIYNSSPSYTSSSASVGFCLDATE